MTRLITDFRHWNRDETDVIMTKIDDKWGRPMTKVPPAAGLRTCPVTPAVSSAGVVGPMRPVAAREYCR
jgi:hypothetical protein